MIRVEDKIRSVVERMDKLNYIYEDLQGANLKLDNAELPAFVNVMPLTGGIKITPTMIKLQPKCSFWIVDKVDMDNDADSIQGVVNRCIEYAYEFILTLNESKLFEPVENQEISYQVITSDMDANVSGVVIELQLKEKKGLILCGKPANEYFNDNEGGSEEGCF